MDNLRLAQLLYANSPSNGGLNATNYPNPYGLRAYKNQDGSYGGEMMPKYTGWLGPLLNSEGDTMTEYSTGDDKGDFPSMVPGLSAEEIGNILRGNITDSAYRKALEFANQRRAQGLSPFKDVWDK